MKNAMMSKKIKEIDAYLLEAIRLMRCKNTDEDMLFNCILKAKMKVREIDLLVFNN